MKNMIKYIKIGFIRIEIKNNNVKNINDIEWKNIKIWYDDWSRPILFSIFYIDKIV